jgi:hypothetical protein
MHNYLICIGTYKIFSKYWCILYILKALVHIIIYLENTNAQYIFESISALFFMEHQYVYVFVREVLVVVMEMVMTLLKGMMLL